MAVYVFVDTNVLLHYTFFRDVDWALDLGTRSVTLVFAPLVIEELDKRKWVGSRHEKDRAKRVLKALSDISLSVEPVRVRNGVAAQALDDEPDDAFMAQHRLRARSADDRLLASVVAFQLTLRPEDSVLVMTADTGLRIKAKTRRIATVAPADERALPVEPDETERALERTRRELAAARSAAPDLRVVLADGTPQQNTVQLFRSVAAAQRQRFLAAWRRLHPRVDVSSESIVMPGGRRIALGVISNMLGEDATAHNAEVERVFGQLEAYLDAWPAALNRIRRCIAIVVVLENHGTAPADDVDLVLWADANGTWCEEPPDIPDQPAMPRPRDPLSRILDFDAGLINAKYSDRNGLSIRYRDDPIDGPHISEDGRAEVHYAVRRAMHHVPCPLPKIYFQFAADRDVASFTIHYKLVAANIRERHEGRLHIKVERPEAVAAPPPAGNFQE